MEVIRQTPAPMAYDTFLANYTKLYEVEFDEEEMEKYFDTSDMDEIVGKLSAYGVTNDSFDSTVFFSSKLL